MIPSKRYRESRISGGIRAAVQGRRSPCDRPQQAVEQVCGLFRGTGSAIFLGFPGTTEDIDRSAAKDADNGHLLIAAVRQLGFRIDDVVERDIIAGNAFIQLTDGPFDLRIVFAPGYPARSSASLGRR